MVHDVLHDVVVVHHVVYHVVHLRGAVNLKPETFAWPKWVESLDK